MCRMTLPDIVRNAFDVNYSVDRAAADLGSLMLEWDRIKRKGNIGSPRLRELDRLIPIQERLALRKLRGDKIFDQLARLGIRLENA